jgi:epoxyqueuosine reductase QueG
MNIETKEKIRNMVLSFGADVCGFTSIDHLTNIPKGFRPTDIYHDCQSILVLGLALPKGLSKVPPQLIYNYFNGYIVTMVDDLLLRVAKEIEHEFGGFTVPIPCDMSGSWDENTLTAHGILSMKHLAVAAGIGFMGKNTLLCNERFGNMMTVGAILLSHNLPSDEPCVNHCPPKCHICIDNCPTHAIREDGTVNQTLCRPAAYGTTFRGYGTVECNRCRMLCPLRFGVNKSEISKKQ